MCGPLWLLLGLLEALQYVLPVHNVPYGFDVVWSDILVLEVVGVLPHVNTEERNKTCTVHTCSRVQGQHTAHAHGVCYVQCVCVDYNSTSCWLQWILVGTCSYLKPPALSVEPLVAGENMWKC